MLGYPSTVDNPELEQKFEAARLRLMELKERYRQTQQEMMIVWWEVKGQYEGGDAAEIAKDFKKIARDNITFSEAETMLSSDVLDDSGKEYVATLLMKKFIAEGRDEEAVNIATTARKKGFYRSMDIDSLNANLVRTLKQRNPQLYRKAKENLGPNTRPYV